MGDGAKINKWLLAVAAVVVLAAVFLLFGFRWAASYYLKRGLEFYYRDNVSGTYFQEAKVNLERSVKLNPKNPLPYVFLSRIALGAQDEKTKYYPNADWAAALPLFKKALELGIEKVNSGSYAFTLEALGHAYRETGQYKEAREMYLRKINSFPDSFFGVQFFSTFWPRLLTAEMDFDYLDKPEEARDLLLPIANPKNADPQNIYRVYSLLSRLSYYFGDKKDAELYAKLAIESAGDNKNTRYIQNAHLILAFVAATERNLSLAEKEIQNAIHSGMGAEASGCLLAFAYLLGGDYMKASEIARAVTPLPQGLLRGSYCPFTLAESSLKKGDTAGAKKYIQDYMAYTDSLKAKNIFVLRNREKLSAELEKLK
jgi:tetratricopeptide (TPR) repeat protein